MYFHNVLLILSSFHLVSLLNTKQMLKILITYIGHHYITQMYLPVTFHLGHIFLKEAFVNLFICSFLVLQQ